MTQRALHGLCPPLTCTTSQSQSGHRQTGRCWILQRPSAAEVWPASRIPSAGWQKTGRTRPLSRRSSRMWRSSSVWRLDAGLRSPGHSWRSLAVLSLPSPFSMKEKQWFVTSNEANRKFVWEIIEESIYISIESWKHFLRSLSVDFFGEDSCDKSLIHEVLENIIL